VVNIPSFFIPVLHVPAGFKGHRCVFPSLGCAGTDKTLEIDVVMMVEVFRAT
jgi:hypothetical protein